MHIECIWNVRNRGGNKRCVPARGTLRLSSNNKYKSNGVGYTLEEFLSEFITIFLLQSLLRRLERIAFSSRRGLFADRFVVVSGFADEPSLERNGYQFDSDAVKEGNREQAGEKTLGWRGRHSISLFSRMEGGTHPSVRSCHSPRIMVAE